MADRKQKISTTATLSILAALGSFALTCTGRPWWGLIAAILSEPLGLFGLFLAASPRVRGGFISLTAIILGALALIVAILGVMGWAVGSVF